MSKTDSLQQLQDNLIIEQSTNAGSDAGMVEVTGKLQAYQQLQKQMHRLALLNELAIELNTTTTADEVFEVAAAKAKLIAESDDVSVMLLNSSQDKMEVSGLEDNSTLVVPLITSGGATIGTLNIGSKKLDAYGPDDKSQMLQLASLIAARIENLRLIEQAQNRAAELEAMANFLDTIVDSVPNGVFVKDAESLNFIRWNKANESLIGLAKEDVLGKSDYDFFPKNEADFFVATDRRILAEGKPVDIPEEEIHTVHRGVRLLHTKKVPLFDANGKPRYLLGVSEDITERKQLDEALSKRAIELETVAEVSVGASTILDTNKLLWEVTNLTKERFNLYHAHIYLLNDAEDILHLRAGAGEVGQKMVNQGWQISVHREASLVAQAARTRQGVIENKVHKNPDFLPNPLLPDTRAEMAVPMIVGNKLLGILDVQAAEVDFFTQEDVRIQSILAAQIAVAVQNAERYERSRAALAEARESQELLENQAHRLLLLNEMGAELNQAGTVEEILSIVVSKMILIVGGQQASVALLNPAGDKLEIVALDGVKNAVALGTDLPIDGTQSGKAVREKHLINTPNIDKAADFLENRQLARQGFHSIMTVPLIASGQVLGVLNVGSQQLDAYGPRDESLMLQVASLLSSALENKRLLQQAQTRAHRERILREVTAQIRSSVDIDTVMRTAAREVGQVLGRPIFVRLNNNHDEKDNN